MPTSKNVEGSGVATEGATNCPPATNRNGESAATSHASSPQTPSNATPASKSTGLNEPAFNPGITNSKSNSRVPVDTEPVGTSTMEKGMKGAEPGFCACIGFTCSKRTSGASCGHDIGGKDRTRGGVEDQGPRCRGPVVKGHAAQSPSDPVR